MITKILIEKVNKSIPKGFELLLNEMTVITGENNSGKTNFLSALVRDEKTNKFEHAKFYDGKGLSFKP